MFRDDRGQSIQIGAVLLFGALVIALAGYQAFVVPQQNERLEFSHSQTVQDELQDLRNAFVSATGDASPRSVSVTLGTRYPDRIFAVNPGPPSGSLRTAGTTDPGVAMRVGNARASGETGDFWDGTDRVYSTGSVVYRPNYNVYGGAPTTVYEHSALVNDFGSGTVPLAGQAFVEGKTVTLVALNGSLDTTRPGTASVDVRPVSASTRTVSVTNTGGSRVTLKLPTRFEKSVWEDLLADQMAPDGYVESVDVISGSPTNTLVVNLRQGENYTLRLAKAGVGTRVTETSEAYLTGVSGNGTRVPEGGSQQFVVEVRDAYNNPVSGVSVTASPSWASGSSTATSNEAGRAAFVFEIPDDAGGLNGQVNVSLGSNPLPTPFDPETAENVGLAVTVLDTSVSGTGGGDGTGPDVISQDVTPDPVKQGETVTLTATIDDVERGGLDVIEAEWFRVAPDETIAGQDPGNGSANPMSVFDGEWNQPTEDITDTATASWEPGDHEIVFRGRDANGNWGPTRTATVTVTPRVIITAAEPDPEKLPDSDGEFVQLEVSTGVDTSGWVLTDTESGETRQTISNVDGTVYFARNPSAFADQWDGVDASDVKQLDIGFMNNGGDSVELRNDSGAVVDRFAYKGPTFDDGSTFTFNSGSPRQVVYRTQSGGSYVDTDSESDWDEEGECAFFGGGNGCSPSGAFQSTDTTALLPDIGQQRQTFTFTPDTQIPSGTQIEISLDDPQQQSPLQVDYQGDVNTNVSTSNTNSNTNGDTAFLTITPNQDIAAGETVRVWTDEVRTGSDGQYDVTFTRGDSGVSTTTTFDVGRNTGGAEIRNFEATDLDPDTSSQQQTFTFTLDSDLDGGERINIGLSPAESPDDVSYQGISSVNVSTSNTNFNKNNGRAWVLIEAPSGGLSAGTGVEVVVSTNTDQMTGAPYEIGITRGDTDTTSTTFDTAGADPSVTLSVTTGNCNNGEGSGYCASWNVTDPDGDATNVTTIIEDNNGNNLQTMTSMFAATGSNSGNHRHENINGSPEQIRIIARDANENKVEKTKPLP
jgi:hypothetical protein